MYILTCVNLLLFLGLKFDFVSGRPKDKFPVNLKEKWKGTCRDVNNVSYRRGQHIDDGCYRYSCVRMKRFVSWSKSDKFSQCCFVGSIGYPKDKIISNTTEAEGCLRRVQVCNFEEKQPIIETELIPLCCLFMGTRYPLGTIMELGLCGRMKCEMTTLGPDIIMEIDETYETGISVITTQTTSMLTETSTLIPTTVVTTTASSETTTKDSSLFEESTTNLVKACFTEKGFKCIFPFISDDNEEVSWCLPWKNLYSWCATAIDSKGKYTLWGKCQEMCPFGLQTTEKVEISTVKETSSTTIQSTISSECVTTKGESCVFPFIDDSEVVEWCVSWKGKYWWCATAVDSIGKYTKWGTCTSPCPEGPPTSRTLATTSSSPITISTTTSPLIQTSTTTSPKIPISTPISFPTPIITTTSTPIPINTPTSLPITISITISHPIPITTSSTPSETCSSEADERCSSEKGYCMETKHCPSQNYVHNKCPDGENIKCCLSIPFQEPDCKDKGGLCKDECGECEGGFLTGACPKQPESIKCCVEDEIVENCNEENEVTTVPSECVQSLRTGAKECSSEPSKTCAAEKGFCGNPEKCPGQNTVDNKCPGGNDNKCCLSMPYQEKECEAEGGVCGDKCACGGEVLHGFCPSQPNSIKCCKGDVTEATEGCTTPLSCPGGYNTNCNNGVCTVTCSGSGGNNNNNNNNNGRRRRRRKRSTGEICEALNSTFSPTTTSLPPPNCSTEPDDRCSSIGGYCMKASSCPEGNYENNKCPGDNSIKCCLASPFQEDECQAQGGQCTDQCACQGESLPGFCPNQPRSIRCCVQKKEELGDPLTAEETAAALAIVPVEVKDSSVPFCLQMDVKDTSKSTRGAQAKSVTLWAKGIVPYAYDKSVLKDDKDTIIKAMAYISLSTCIQFKPKNTEKDYLKIYRECKPGQKPGKWWQFWKDDCFNGAYVLGLGAGSPRKLCISAVKLDPRNQALIGLMVHELFHALGVIHTQKRPDRDSYITVHDKEWWEFWYTGPIKRGSVSQYSPPCSKCKTYKTPYDCMSIMHYRDYTFSSEDPKFDIFGNPTNTEFKPTMTAKQSGCDLRSDNHLYMTSSDIDLIKNMYASKCVGSG